MYAIIVNRSGGKPGSTVKCNTNPTDYCYIRVYKHVNGTINVVRGCSTGNPLPEGLGKWTTYNLGINMICILEIIE